MSNKLRDNEMTQNEPERRGIQSVETAANILRVLAEANGPMSLKEISDTLGTHPSKMHRYLASLVKVKLVHQAKRASVYDLGQSATHIGLAAVARMDLVNLAGDALQDLVATTNFTALLSVWSQRGPIVVRLEKSVSHVITTIGLGTRLPVLTSATGRVFLAYTSETQTKAAVKTEINRGEKIDPQRLIRETREAGFASVSGKFIPGLYAISCPVLNWQGEADAAMTLYSNQESLADPDQIGISKLLNVTRSLSLH